MLDKRTRDVSTTPPIIPTPRRRWLQFSLRGVIVVVSVRCVLLGWLGIGTFLIGQHTI